ncbi:MAG: toxin C-terminal domain-containing protein, partial [Bacteroidales bacterium]|nr:toxin C-terminal domain-containing protein [Bacteroidales bacterium]
CAGNPVNRIDPDGTDDKDKIAGAIIGVFTNIIPGTGSLRDVYKPSDASDYNRALQKADAVSLIAGAAMISGGGTMAAAGETISTAGAAAAVTIVGAPEGAAALAGGAATATAGEAIAGLGAMMMANAADNAKDGYDRGKQNTSSDNSNNAPVNKEAGLPEVPIPEGYSKTHLRSQGRAVYKKGHYYITRDNTQHNGGVWKKAKSVKDLQNRERRMGTYDEKLNRIGD